MPPYSRHAKGPAVAESVALVALGLTLSSDPIHQSVRRFRDLPCRPRFPDDCVAFSVSADSRSGRIKRARNYTT